MNRSYLVLFSLLLLVAWSVFTGCEGSKPPSPELEMTAELEGQIVENTGSVAKVNQEKMVGVYSRIENEKPRQGNWTGMGDCPSTIKLPELHGQQIINFSYSLSVCVTEQDYFADPQKYITQVQQ